MTRADRILIAVLAALALLSWPIAGAWATDDAVVITGPGGTTVVPLEVDRTLQVQGDEGGVTVAIRAGHVLVTDSDCPDQVCVHTGSIHRPGAVIACVPNGVVVRIGSGGDDGFDARIR
jgi:hypothetical protein